ncbi:uncharacterized protein LOC126839168 isoform X2 [Adelges cooleyi]|uniref:uncharacterized protein LOC126839168 isoform X2 n=1 Tax=Adelges cooleyi TaxID=133065 RepID=UPI00217FC95A|nr:uncharacterized protein LOC126839168 isoform X2 [Adelges cooleyi]
MTAAVQVSSPPPRLLASAAFLSCLFWSASTTTADHFNASLSASGNALWDDLLGKCDGPRTTMDCVRSRLYNYVNGTFDGDISVTDGIRFTRNANDYEALCAGSDNGTVPPAGAYRQARDSPSPADAEEANKVEDDHWSHVTDSLYDKGAKYLMTHDFEASVPGFLSGGPGAKVRLSPKNILPDGGVILRMDFLPAVTGTQNQKEDRAPRFLHKKMKQMFKKKLLTSFLALLLIVKLIKIKLFFLLPLIVGVGTAKKILLKVLLHLFPPLSHLFKMCSYYHHNAAKFHFHHHKIKHHHHHIKVPVPVPIPAKPPVYHHDDLIYTGAVLDHPPGPYDSPEIPGNEYYNRLDMANVVSDHGDELASWGLGENGEATPNYEPPPPPPMRYGGGPQLMTPSYPHAEKYIKRGDENGMIGVSRVPQQAPHDPVFGPILYKLEEIFRELHISDEPCKEKLVCRMYGNPGRYSPHSNLVSAQLSSETAASSAGRAGTSADASRLWKYIQAAKEGQNGEDCRTVYPTCTLVGLR